MLKGGFFENARQTNAVFTVSLGRVLGIVPVGSQTNFRTRALLAKHKRPIFRRLVQRRATRQTLACRDDPFLFTITAFTSEVLIDHILIVDLFASALTPHAGPSFGLVVHDLTGSLAECITRQQIRIITRFNAAKNTLHTSERIVMRCKRNPDSES